MNDPKNKRRNPGGQSEGKKKKKICVVFLAQGKGGNFPGEKFFTKKKRRVKATKRNWNGNWGACQTEVEKNKPGVSVSE